MRKPIKVSNLIENKSVIRYEDNLYVFHLALASEEGHVKYIVSALNGKKVRIIHNRDRKDVTLEYHMN